MNKEELLAEAKRRYPIGTVFYPAHFNMDKDEYKYIKCIVTNQDFEFTNSQGCEVGIVALTDEGKHYCSNDKYGNTVYDRIVYKDGKWAEIISLPSEYLVGTSVKVVMDSMNASQFNTKDCPYNGVYSIKLWRNEIFTICGEHKLYKGYEDEYQNCYPLAHNKKLVGYVYSKGLKPYKEEFKLPEKWCIETINQEVVDYCNEYGKMPPYSIVKGVYAHFPNYDGLTTCGEVKPGFTLITFEQFKKHILNEAFIPENKRPYSDIKNITYEMITTHPYFKTLDEDELTSIINRMEWYGFEKLPGKNSKEKAKLLIKSFQQTNSVMKTFPITRTQFQYIYDVACSGWKSKINTMVQEKLGTFGTSCELSYEVVDIMFKAATTEQTKTLVKIFPDYSTDKSVNLFEKRDDTLFTRESSQDGMINIRSNGNYRGRAFYLLDEFKWELKRDDSGDLCLIPTLK